MASSLAEDLVCPICLALFQEPHMLGCGHNFCLGCLRSAVPAGQEKGTCPECRGPFQLRKLKRNRVLGNLAEKARRYKLDEKPLPPGRTAVGLWPLCEAHEEPLKLFCTQDEAPICVICRDLPQHRGHDFLPTKDAVQRAQGKLKAYLKTLEEFMKKNAEDEIDQQQEIAALKNCTEDLLGHISKEFEALHQILHKKEQDIKSVVEKMKAENMEEMEDFLTFLKEEASSHIETIAEIKAALEATDHVFLKGFMELVKKIKEDYQGNTDEDENSEDEYREDEDSEDEDENGEDEYSEDEDEDSEDEDEDREDEDSEDEDENGEDEYSEDEDEDSEDEDENGEDENGEDEYSEDEDSEDEDSEDEDENGEDENSNEEETSDADRYNTKVVTVAVALKMFKDFLNFEAWKEKFERIIPGKELALKIYKW
ncbi:UNVERIFIED_CONTAM: hypothetical protein K2H54_060312 [Gekko kuhli]